MSSQTSLCDDRGHTNTVVEYYWGGHGIRLIIIYAKFKQVQTVHSRGLRIRHLELQARRVFQTLQVRRL